jgi:NDP-sugar pyrophosphorylase family protein
VLTVDVAAAMVLAAGRGQRMRPLSDVVPKPALPLPGGPLMGWSIRLVCGLGTSRVVVNGWHLAHRVARVAAEAVGPYEGVELAVSRENELMGTAGGIALARDRGLLGDDGPVVVANGDVVQALDLAPVLERHDSGVDDVTLALLPHLDPLRWSRVEVDPVGRVTTLRPPGPPTTTEVPLLYPGVMVVSRSALDRLPSGPGETPERLWAPARSEGRLGGVVVSGHWREVGTPEAYLETALALCCGRARADADAAVDPAARVANAFIGEGSRVEADAVVDSSVVAEGATVGRGAHVVRSVIFGRVRIEAGAEVADEVRVPA